MKQHPLRVHRTAVDGASHATAASPLSAADARKPGQPNCNVQPSVTEGKITFA